MSTIRSPSSSQLITPNFSSVPIVFHRFFAWIALGNADLYFSFMLVGTANAAEKEIK
jgi:hypothetical protein